MSKNDIKIFTQIIQSLLKNFATKDDLKDFATKDDLKELAKQKDLLEVKKNLEDLTEFAKEGIGNLLDWTNEIHRDIVKEELPKRVRKLEDKVFPN